MTITGHQRLSSQDNQRRARVAVVATAMALIAPPPALADPIQPFTSQGLSFVTVGAPGNRGVTPEEAPGWPHVWAQPPGAVAHEYAIMRTNVTNEQWIEFVRAYAPHFQGVPFDPSLTGFRINYLGAGPGGPTYAVQAGSERHTASMSWRVAARYANWLHNGKVNEAWAFESGAYDTSTFGVDPQGKLTDQVTHSPGARFWIPSLDEYVKAAYYDPNRYGPGEEGFWLYPNADDEPLIAGPPGIGEAAGDTIPWSVGIDVGSYPDTQSPWGLWDVSSTESQYSEGWVHPTIGLQRMRHGSILGDSSYFLWDRIDLPAATGSQLASGALRIATLVPSPTVSAFGLALLLAPPHRRRYS